MKDAGGALEFPNFTFFSTKKEDEYTTGTPALIEHRMYVFSALFLIFPKYF
jgi:hypothetical protein